MKKEIISKGSVPIIKNLVYKCEDCEAVVEEEDLTADVLYECDQCGSVFASESNRCEDCGKFASRIADHGCTECGSGELMECEETDEDLDDEAEDD